MTLKAFIRKLYGIARAPPQRIITHLSSEDDLARLETEANKRKNIEEISYAALSSMAHLKPIRAAGTMPGADGYKKARDRDNMSISSNPLEAAEIKQ